MRIKILILGVVCLLVIGCSAISEISRNYHVHTYTDEFENYELYEQRYNRGHLVLAGLGGMDALDLAIRKYLDGTKLYFIIAYRDRPKWFFFQDNPLQIKADDKIFKFPFITRKSNVLDASVLQEWAYFKADIESINEIMKAEKVIGKLFGRDGFDIIEYKPIVFQRWEKFLRKYDK